MRRNRTTLLAGAAGAAALALTLTLAAGAASDAGEAAAPAPAAAAHDEHAGHAAPAEQQPGEEQAALSVVPNDEVCMVNDRFFGRDQIPVEVEGATYYGCCEGCKQRLAEDRTVRFAVDPVTGEEVDKAKAVIGARPDGTVLYFASQESFEKHLAGGA